MQRLGDTKRSLRVGSTVVEWDSPRESQSSTYEYEESEESESEVDGGKDTVEPEEERKRAAPKRQSAFAKVRAQPEQPRKRVSIKEEPGRD